MKITLGDLADDAVIALLNAHYQDMLNHSPQESVHAFDTSKLAADDVTFWTVWIEGELAGCGALKQLDNEHGEIKSMRTAAAHLRKGVAAELLAHILQQAKQLGLTRVSLETGTAPAFTPALTLYQKSGFAHCLPFANYELDPYSQFMSLELIE